MKATLLNPKKIVAILIVLTLGGVVLPEHLIPVPWKSKSEFVSPGGTAKDGQTYVLGTDYIERPFSLVLLRGMRSTLRIAILGTAAVLAGCILLGTLHGSTNSRLLEGLLSASALGVMALPEAAVLIAVANSWSRLAPATYVNLSMIGVLIVFAIPAGARLVADLVRKLGGEGFVEASRAYGAGSFYTFRKDIWPHLVDDLAWVVATILPRFVAIEIGLAVLGVEYREFEGLGKVLKKSVDYPLVSTAVFQLIVTIAVILWAALLPQILLRMAGIHYRQRETT